MQQHHEQNVTTRDIVLRLDEKVDTLLESVSEMKPKIDQIDDHETRLRQLESFRQRIPSTAIFALLVSLIGAAIAARPHF